MCRLQTAYIPLQTRHNVSNKAAVPLMTRDLFKAGLLHTTPCKALRMLLDQVGHGEHLASFSSPLHCLNYTTQWR